MSIISNVELWWVKLNPARPTRYQNKATDAAKWSLQIRVKDKARKAQLEKDFGFAFTPVEEDGKLAYKTSISCFAFKANQETKKEDPNSPNSPVAVILATGEPIDPDTVGNGSVGNIRFRVKDDKSSRTLLGVQVTKWLKYVPREEEDQFELEDDYEIIEPKNREEDSPY